jgi:hypothetical protein
LTLNATVNPVVRDSSFPALDGTLTFTDVTTNTVLATVGVIQAGSATSGYNGTAITDVAVTQLVLGQNSIVATYNGGSNYEASSSTPSVVVNCTAGCGNGTGQSLELAFYQSTPASHIISPSTTSTTPVDVTATGGFTGAVNLTCSVTGTKSNDVDIPQCSFNPATIAITDPDSVRSTLTVTTTGPTASAALVPANRLWLAAQESLTLACLVFFGFPGRRPSLTLLRALLCMVALGGMLACGGGTSGSQGGGAGGGANKGTTQDTYTITFYAADAATGKLTAQDYFTLQVD